MNLEVGRSGNEVSRKLANIQTSSFENELFKKILIQGTCIKINVGEWEVAENAPQILQQVLYKTNTYNC